MECLVAYLVQGEPAVHPPARRVRRGRPQLLRAPRLRRAGHPCRGEALEAPGIARLSHRLRCVVNDFGLRHDWEGPVAGTPGPGKEFNPPGEPAGEQTVHYPHGAGVGLEVCVCVCVCVCQSPFRNLPGSPGGPCVRRGG